ncbi:MAG: glutaredoxin 3 [gamma proteobacterium symbiont of Bathyaustriella thionipta]|nr:glutaredoxin 3 [gamma proteobacterium symbiont of Bathyaustriella thionipta]MCU7950968.1 glutaredoxin 3 [gamma proteobacterium symbiont of Bathyaustriella thionipta]MCU7953489.1 glutaredoxin 3 [gamma proteobacterium symbiont of Bathyaustriella thionipta]MCU7957459.1 glutaredoxin 3 [gamma proteobacterium symbiont of Bathyaustriella thionipta]MCU7966483.1 glutaredoxin 3 [gamma proteobacterium symbiont of Bathyaustriella thionipta]
MANVTMYCTDSCPFCINAEKLLLSKGVEIDKIDIEQESEKFAEISTQIGRDSVPQIFIDGKHIGGFDDLSELDMDDELDPMLGLL